MVIYFFLYSLVFKIFIQKSVITKRSLNLIILFKYRNLFGALQIQSVYYSYRNGSNIFFLFQVSTTKISITCSAAGHLFTKWSKSTLCSLLYNLSLISDVIFNITGSVMGGNVLQVQTLVLAGSRNRLLKPVRNLRQVGKCRR